MLTKTFVKSCKQVIKVTTAGFEPARPFEHQPLKLASLPFLHVAANKNWRDSALQCLSSFCNSTGASL